MPRITIDLDEKTFQILKDLERLDAKPLGELISSLVAHSHDTRHPFEWPTYDMGRPLVDLADRAAIARILDEEDR